MPSDIYEDLTNKLAQCLPQGDLILMGDLNARTQTLPDFINNENNDHIPVPPPELYQTDTEIRDRWNVDTGSNSYGNKFLNLCKSLPLRILNGRFLGDLLGNYTCFTPRGSSTVDYAAVSPNLLKQIRHFLVSDPCLHLSDHTPIEVCLSVRASYQSSNSTSNIDMLPRPDKIVWDKNLAQKYKFILESPDCTESINGFINTGILPTQQSVDSATSFLSNVMCETAKLAGMQIKKGAVPRRSARVHQFSCNRKQPTWHDIDCHLLQSDLKRTSKLVTTFPRDPWLRGKLLSDTKKYNRLVKLKHKKYIDDLFSQLDSMHKSEPRKYMQLVNSLKEGNFDKIKPSDTSSVSPEEWFSHFSSLLGKPNNPSLVDLEMENFLKNNIDNIASEMEQPITKKELLRSIKCLKNNKSTSFDGISNEMLKHGIEPLSKSILLLFNTILTFNVYPIEWKKDILGPLHKSGDKSDPNNFRGICISSCFGKLFNSILRNRLSLNSMHQF